MRVNYYCSGFDVSNAFWPELGEKFKNEMNNTKSIVYIPGSPQKVEKAKTKYVPVFTEHFKRVGIEFEESYLITPEMDSTVAKKLIDNASFIMLMGGDPFAQKEMCEKLGILENLKNYTGVMLGFSAGAMLMSKYIIIIPCSEEYPDFRIEPGLNLSEISIYPHNNFDGEEYPDKVCVGDETYYRNDLLKVAKEYGEFYLLQDYLDGNGLTNVSLIRTCGSEMEFIIQNNGKIFKATSEGIELISKEKNNKIKKI